MKKCYQLIVNHHQKRYLTKQLHIIRSAWPLQLQKKLRYQQQGGSNENKVENKK